MTTRTEIREAFIRGQQKEAGYMIVVCDTFDYENYPVYAKDITECRSKYNEINGHNMQKVMEVYDLNGNIEEQLNIPRCNKLF